MAGAFQTSREIFDNPIWQNVVEFRLFFLIYGKATFTDGVRIGNIELKRGQWIRSYRNLQHDLEYIENNAVKRYSLATIKRAIDKLTRDGRLFSKTCEHGTLFEVVNYSKYQCLDNYANGSLEQQRNGNETATKQQRNNNKNAKNAKNAKNEIYSSIFEHWNSKNIIVHKKLTDEFRKDIDEALNVSTQEEILKAINHYAEAYHNPNYKYCEYKWGIHEFLTRKEGYKRFLDDGSKWLNYLRCKNNKPKQDKPQEEGNPFFNMLKEEGKL